MDNPKNAPKATDRDIWHKPQPLPKGLPDVEPFDMDMLPASLRTWVADICERVQCPPDFVAVSVMTALGGIVGTKVAIRPQAKTDWTEVGNQWAMVIGRPGILKSPAMEQALAPVKRLSMLAMEKHETAMRDYAAEAWAAKLRTEARETAARKKLKDNPLADIAEYAQADESEKPVLRRYLANNTTAEALGELLRQNPQGLLVYRDELVSLLHSLEHEDAAEARGFYLQAWNGASSFTFDRIVRGLNLHIPLVCLSLLGSTQPARIAGFVHTARTGGNFDDGMLQRFGLMVWPDDPGSWRNVDRWPDGQAKATAFQVFQYLDSLSLEHIKAQQDTTPDGAPEGLPYLRFEPEALEYFVGWRTQLETELRSDDTSDMLVSHFMKYRKLVPGLALLLHLANREPGPVGSIPLLQALAWAEYLKKHAIRVYSSGTQAEIPAAKAILAKLRSGALVSPFSSKDVWRPQWTHLTEPAKVQKALALLVDFDWLDMQTEQTGGRPRTVYVVNPRGLKP